MIDEKEKLQTISDEGSADGYHQVPQLRDKTGRLIKDEELSLSTTRANQTELSGSLSEGTVFTRFRKANEIDLLPAQLPGAQGEEVSKFDDPGVHEIV